MASAAEGPLFGIAVLDGLEEGILESGRLDGPFEGLIFGAGEKNLEKVGIAVGFLLEGACVGVNVGRRVDEREGLWVEVLARVVGLGLGIRDGFDALAILTGLGEEIVEGQTVLGAHGACVDCTKVGRNGSSDEGTLENVGIAVGF